MLLPILLDIFLTILIAAIAAGLLWLVARYLPPLITRYAPDLTDISVRLLRGLIFVSGLISVGRFVNFGAVTVLVTIAGVYWCIVIFRETYRLTINEIQLDPIVDSSPHTLSAKGQEVVGERVTDPDTEAVTSGTVGTMTPAYKMLQNRMAIESILEQVEPTLDIEQPSVLMTYLSEWRGRPIILPHLPTSRLNNRSKLGKQTIQPFQ